MTMKNANDGRPSLSQHLRRYSVIWLALLIAPL
jgi:hypothetical protein